MKPYKSKFIESHDFEDWLRETGLEKYSKVKLSNGESISAWDAYKDGFTAKDIQGIRDNSEYHEHPPYTPGNRTNKD